MDTILPYALLCFTSFFTLTNPLGTMPVFLTMTNGLEEKERQHIVKRATIISGQRKNLRDLLFRHKF